MRKVLLLGASGSIGNQTLDILDKYSDRFTLTAFSVGHKSEIIPDLIRRYKSVKDVYLIDSKLARALRKEYPNINFYSGKGGLAKITRNAKYDMCVDALVGFSGMEPAIIALRKNKILCLANKEALVSGGTIINRLLRNGHGKLYPIDSEHVAIAKCFSRVNKNNVDKILITASGGALRHLPIEKLTDVTPEEALAHPTWKMGKKITIDCATMMNKGFEIIEAYYLFGYPLDKVDVLMHDESLVHSLLKLKDGSYVADYGKPDMHNPIEYALLESKSKYDVMRVKSFDEFKDSHFHEYNKDRYPLCELAKKCLKEGASKMIALNASNEVAVSRFLNHEISFPMIYEIVSKVVNNTKLNKDPSLKEVKTIDKKAREEANR